MVFFQGPDHFDPQCRSQRTVEILEGRFQLRPNVGLQGHGSKSESTKKADENELSYQSRNRIWNASAGVEF